MGIIKLKNTKEESTVEVAKEQQNAMLQAQVEKAWDDPAVLREDESKIDENTRRYILNNRTAKTIISAEPVNFFDEEEKKWKFIDNSLVEQEKAFVSKSGTFKTEISKADQGQSVKIRQKGKEVSWEYLGKENLFGESESVGEKAETTLKVFNGTRKEKRRMKSNAVYENIEKDTDLEYCLQGNNLKENIIVKERSANYRYVFALKTAGLKLRLSENNQSLELYSETETENGMVEQKVEFTIPSPYMYDANGVSSEEVYYELSPTEDGKYAFAVVASEEWMNAQERAFPVTIDPQIVTNQTELITKKTEYRNVYTNSSLGSGVSYSSWYTTSTSNIKVYRTSYIEYKTSLTVKRSLIALETDDIASVKLVLTPTKSFSGYLYCNGAWTYYSTSSGDLKIDVTNKFKNSTNNFTVALEPYSSIDMQFTDPKLEIQTLTDENVLPTKKSYSLAGVAVEEVDFTTGEAVTVFNDVQNTNALLGLSVFHVYKKHAEDLFVGKNFRLNLHEKFEKNNGTYVYTDAKGDVYGFKEHHYQLDDAGNKNYILVDKSQITVNAEGRLSYNGDEVFTEYKSQSGLKAIIRIEDYLHNEYYENRNDDERQIAQQLESYKQTLEDYVLINSRGWIMLYLSGYISSNGDFEDFISRIYMYHLMTRSEADRYQILCNQRIDTSESDLLEQEKTNLEERSGIYLEQIKKYYKEYVRLQEELNKCQLQTPVSYLTDEKCVKGYNQYGDLVNIYDRYGNSAVVEYERYDFADLGKKRIARVYDNHEKSMIFTYNPKKQLSCITDARGRKVRYYYDENGRLDEVKYDTGTHLVFEYDENEDIQTITETKVGLKGTVTKTTESSNASKLTIVNESLVSTVQAEGIMLEESEMKPISKYTLTFTKNSFSEMDNVLVETEKQREKYVFDLNKNLKGYYLEEDGLVTKAENYEYQSYWSEKAEKNDPRKVTVQAKKESLYTKSLENYTFVAGDSERTTLNQFNNAVRTETSAIQVSADGTNTVTTVIEYTYDDNQQLIEEKRDTTYSNPSKTITSYKKYSYNGNGDVVRTESYVDGEEYKTGKNIQETFYDKQGRVVKTVTYNMLESSSKYYTESEYDEDGKVVADYDSTGENKTKYSYTNDVINEKEYANGSKFAYGRDLDDTVTSISQSTEVGEENATNQILKNGLVIEVNSGNNKIQYGYDYKRRLKTVTYNGKADYVKYAYTENANYDEIVTTNANNETLTVRKDKRGKVLSSIYGNGMKLLYAYDDKDKLTTVTEKDGETVVRNVSYTYDSLDKILTYSETDGITETYTYNNFGQVLTLTQSTGMNYEYSYSEDSTRKLEKISVAGLTISPQYDILKRNKGKEIFVGSNKLSEEVVTYRKVGDHTTNMPASVYFGGKKAGRYTLNEHLKYAYDGMGNITKITENGELVARYAYDKVNRLVREDNKAFGKTWLFTYDNNGNIVSKRETEFTLKGNVEENTFTMSAYEYERDQLLSHNGETFVYDEIGNPTTYRGKTTTWLGRMLTSYNGHTFTYDAIGRRLTKDGISFTYDSDGKVIKQSNGLEFIYDHTGVVGFTYGNNTYIYRKDVQGNIVGILDNTGKVVVKYTYDAWGNHAVADGNGNTITDETNIGHINPFRYRGYYYDTETELYFLKTRYYDPEIGRFMTIDSISYLNPDAINGLNLYAYCGNNPVMGVDPNGNAWWNPFSWAWSKIGKNVADWTMTITGTIGNILKLPVMAVVAGVVLINGNGDGLIDDFENGRLNPFNQSETVALDSRVLSFYKGELIIRHSLPEPATSMQLFGTIFLNRKEKNNVNGKKTLNHEYGHGVQERILGSLYLTRVAIPSFIYFWATLNTTATDIDYYSTPWERTADYFGGVNRENSIWHYKSNSLEWSIAELLLGPILIPFYFMYGY